MRAPSIRAPRRLMRSTSGLDRGALPPTRQSAAARLAEYAAAAERDRAPASSRQDGHYWNTAQSAAFFTAVIVLALLLAGLAALLIELG